MKINIKTLQSRILAVGAASALFATALTGCNDDSTIGSSLTQDEISVVVNDTSFTLTGHSVQSDTILSRTITQLLGSIDAPGFGTLTSDFVTQFMPANQLDTAGVSVNDIDSLKLILAMDLNAFTGDSLAPMGMEVYRLTKDLKTPIYSTFRPTGMYDPDKCIGQTVYNAASIGLPDSLKPTTSYRMFQVNLPVSLGRELYSAYRANPTDFATPTAFAQNVFKGLYIKNSYGSGRIIRIESTSMRMYWHTIEKNDSTGQDTTIVKMGSYFATTPEVISNNNIHISLAQSLKDAAANGEAIIAAPCGMDVQLDFPALDIIQNYRKNVTNLGIVNSLTMEIPAATIQNKYDIAPPMHLLLVLSDKKDEFFAKNKITDNKTSFYAPYNATTQSYTFTGMREYLLDLMKKDNVTPADYTFTLVPVTISTESSTYSYYYGSTTTVTAITPYVANPVMTKLDLKNAKITLVYTKQNLL